MLRGAATPAAPDGMAVLIAAGAQGALLAPAAVAGALVRGLERGGLAPPEVLELADGRSSSELDKAFQRERFDARLHAARALLIATEQLSERSLPHSAAFELATRARQAGVPAYAVVARSALDAFDARLLDLQLILRARGATALARAAEDLAAVLLAADEPTPHRPRRARAQPPGAGSRSART